MSGIYEIFLRALSIQSEMEAFVQHLEQRYRTDIQSFKTELQAKRVKISELEESVTALAEVVHSHYQRMDVQDSHIHTLYPLPKDQDNHNWRNNIWIRGLPEVMNAEDLPATVRVIITSLLGTTEPVIWNLIGFIGL